MSLIAMAVYSRIAAIPGDLRTRVSLSLFPGLLADANFTEDISPGNDESSHFASL